MLSGQWQKNTLCLNQSANSLEEQMLLSLRQGSNMKGRIKLIFKRMHQTQQEVNIQELQLSRKKIETYH